MQPLSQPDFSKLALFRSSPCISVYLPTHRAGVEVNELQDAQLFKSMLQDTRKELDAKGLKKGEVEAIVQNGAHLLEEDDFWRKQQQGLGVFMAQDFFYTVRMPDPVPQELFIGPHFYVVPLFPLLRLKSFFLLVLSKGNARFFRGNQFGLDEMDVEGLPNGMDDVVRFEEKGGKQMFRRGGSKGKAAFHGHGAGLADETEYLARYLKEIDDTLMTEVLADEKVPLLLAGAEGLATQYRQLTRYPHIYGNSFAGNHEHADTAELFEKATETLSPWFSEDTDKALENYYDHVATALTTADPFKVVAACFYGKVADLFVDTGLHLRGTFNEDTGQARFVAGDAMDIPCLVNEGAIRTFMANGNVHLIDRDRIPDGSKIAAYNRYA